MSETRMRPSGVTVTVDDGVIVGTRSLNMRQVAYWAVVNLNPPMGRPIAAAGPTKVSVRPSMVSRTETTGEGSEGIR